MVLRDLEARLQRLAELKAANGLAFYQPHPKQDEFHANGDKPRRYVRTGNRWGKSTAGVAEDLAWLIGERIWYPEGDPRRTVGIPQRSVKGVLIVQDWDKAEEIFTSQEKGAGMGKIFQLMPAASFIGVDKSQSGHICKVMVHSKWGGISTLYIDTVKSYKQNPQGHESSDWDFVHVDEPLPEGMWYAYARGLVDRKGSAWFMCTPLTEQWINDYFIPRALSRNDFDEGQTFHDEKKKNFWVMTGKSSDNPSITKESISDFSRDVSATELEARLNGKPRQHTGVIYQEFDPDVHVYRGVPFGWRSHTTPPKDWTIRAAIDPHPKIPMAVLFAATGPLGHTYFFTEIFLKLYVKELCETFWSRLSYFEGERKFRYEPHQVLCDPLAWTPNPVTGRTMADAFFDGEIPIQPASKALSDGILRTGEFLRRRDADGNAMMFFSPDLSETLFEFDRYCWDEKKEKPQANCPDHMMENLYRLCMTGLDYVDPLVTYKVIKPLENFKPDLSIPTFSRIVKTGYTLKGRYPN